MNLQNNHPRYGTWKMRRTKEVFIPPTRPLYFSTLEPNLDFHLEKNTFHFDISESAKRKLRTISSKKSRGDLFDDQYITLD